MKSHVTSKVNVTTDRSSPSKLRATTNPVENLHVFPTHHSIKVCIQGKAFSGKKTQAKMIIDHFGGKVTLFDMTEIVREALGYVDPNAQKEEVADPKAKGKKPADEKLDPFAGQDTTVYKEIATALLENVQQNSGDKESIPGKDVDILSLVTEDDLLTKLFTQKLRFTLTEKPPTAEERDSKLREIVLQEKQLLEQLEGGEPVEDKKGKKGGGAKSPEDIQNEIKELLKPDISGWVLVDFPRNLSQAKSLEKMFTGFQIHTDTSKTSQVSTFETWTKFTDPWSLTKEGYTPFVEA